MLTNVAETPHMPSTRPPGEDDRNDDNIFDTLLLSLQSANLLAQTGADATGLRPTGEENTPSSLQARLDTETAAARAELTNARATNGADPSSVMKGTVSSHHERLVAKQQEAGVPTARGDQGAAGAPSPVGSHDALPVAARPESNGIAPSGNTLAAADFTASKTASTDAAPASAAPPVSPPSATSATTSPDAAVAAAPVTAAQTISANRTPPPTSPALQVGRILATSGPAANASTNAANATVGSDAAGLAANARTSSEARQDNAGTTDLAHKSDESGRSQTAKTGAPEASRFDELVKTLRMNLGSRKSTAVIRLDPPGLGSMRIDVRMEDDTLRMRVETSTNEARDLMNARASELSAALREHDIHVERLEVTTARQPDDADQQTDRQTGQHADQHQHDGGQSQTPVDDRAASQRRHDNTASPRSSSDQDNADASPSAEASDALDAPTASARSNTALDVRI